MYIQGLRNTGQIKVAVCYAQEFDGFEKLEHKHRVFVTQAEIRRWLNHLTEKGYRIDEVTISRTYEPDGMED